MADATPAATVAAVRDGAEALEVLLLRRNPTGSFAGMWVFPGGRVDELDRQGAAAEETVGAAGSGNEGAPDEIAAARRAAVREADEEAGLRLEPDGLAILSWWLPPAEAARRFATWFFVAAASEGDIVVDQREVHEHVWVTPAEALARRDRGEVALAPPTWMTLHWLADRTDVATALADAAAGPLERFVTRIVVGDAGELVATLWDGDEAYLDGQLDRPGPRWRLVVQDGAWRLESTRPSYPRASGGTDRGR